RNSRLRENKSPQHKAPCKMHFTVRLHCGVGSESYALEMSAVSSVRQAAEIQPVSTDAMKGQVGEVPVQGGDAIPVFSMAERLQSPDAVNSERDHVVIVRTSRGMLGLIVGSVSHVISVPAANLLNVPPVLIDPRTRVIKGLVNLDGLQSADLSRDDSESDEVSMCIMLSPERLHPKAPVAAAIVPAKPTAIAESPATNSSLTGSGGQVVLLSVTDDESEEMPLLGFSVTQIAEVQEPRRIIHVPGSPDHVLGFVVWRSRPVPVIDLGRRVGLPGETADQRLIIARGKDDSELMAFPRRQRFDRCDCRSLTDRSPSLRVFRQTPSAQPSRSTLQRCCCQICSPS
ncbi:MAG: chemotaxis signal transduction protein, partial [Planctomycetaceae bacterium]